MANAAIARATKADSHLQRVAQHGHDQYKPLQGAHISPPEVKSIVFELCKRILGRPTGPSTTGAATPPKKRPSPSEKLLTGEVIGTVPA